MALAPKSPEDILRFIDEVPYWTAEKHGKNTVLCIRFTLTPNILSTAEEFVRGVTQRYTEYARSLSPKLGIPVELFNRFYIHFCALGCALRAV